MITKFLQMLEETNKVVQYHDEIPNQDNKVHNDLLEICLSLKI